MTGSVFGVTGEEGEELFMIGVDGVEEFGEEMRAAFWRRSGVMDMVGVGEGVGVEVGTDAYGKISSLKMTWRAI